AQTVRGVVVDAASTPVAGVVVLLVNGATVVARSLSNNRGEFRLAPGVAGMYRVRTLRIGYRPVTSAPLTLRAGETVSQRIALTGVRLELDTIKVVDRRACRTTGDSAVATFAMWEQVRAALTATQLTASARVIVATTVRYERTVDPGLRHVRDQTANVRSDYVEEPWRSQPMDSLRRFGYVVRGRDDSTTYNAPGIEVLESDAFIADHCFRLASSRDPKLLGIAFEPTPDRRAVAEVAGTLWLDRATSELRQLEFHYVNVPNIPREVSDRSGGDIRFARMRDGGWVIAGWDIRMPLFDYETNLGQREAHIDGFKVSGGELSLARRARDTLWSRPRLALAGTVADSSGRRLGGARIALRGTT
ncbi:MAG: carboxypeptidase-like regulatory domain-containing protein, partial [Gemmatimonadaceae bacterium]